ncbi:MAG: hypothetical protein ACRYGB_13360 [Janthinobacterium lividum]
MDFTQIIKFFLSTSLITGSVVYLMKRIIDKFLESRIEKYKNSLQINTEIFRHELNFEAEKFKQELNTKTVEHQIKYSKLYEERGQIIKLIYNLLLNLEGSLVLLTTIFQGPDWTNDTERDAKTVESVQNLKKELEQNRIFFTSTLCKKVDSIIATSNKIIIEMRVAKIYKQRNEQYYKNNISLNDEELSKPIDIWIKLEKEVQNEIISAKLDLAQEFRILIGVE